jgi:23S rRNA (guanosine2251-2'-O)-methyltransferase
MTDTYIYGLHAVEAALNNPKKTIHRLCINQERSDKRIDTLIDTAQKRAVPLEYLSADLMKQRFSNIVHQGVIAVVKQTIMHTEADLPRLLENLNQPAFILILDGVTDPHNLGACLRSADAAGVHFVIIPKDNSAPITPIVSKVACGAAETMPLVRVTNLARTMEQLKKAGVWLYGAAGEAQTSLYSLDITGSIGVVLGAEGAGLRRLTREHCDDLFCLPMRGTVSSLNVSVATGICLYEVLRRRLT